jgi:Xaa-Pro aminopeptidase
VAEHADRLDRLAAALPAAGVDALLVTDLLNVRYLTGFAGSNGIVVATAGGATLTTDFRYQEAVEPLRSTLDVAILDRDIVGRTAERLGELASGCARIGLEAATLPLAVAERLRGLAPAGVELVATEGVVEGLRRAKSPTEIAATRHASDVLEDVYRRIADGPLVGRTEADVAWEIERMIREAAFPELSFRPIVAAGANGALPHAEPRDVAIGRGDLVVIDIGARSASGYCSDCTRTLAAGGPPSPEAAADYALVLEAQLAGLGAVRPGAVGGIVDATAREVIEAAGCGDLFGHGLGHGTGLEVHEAPTLRKGSEDVLAPGDLVTVEPGLYRPGRWGIRIEDHVVVTEAGHEILTAFPKDLLETPA